MSQHDNLKKEILKKDTLKTPVAMIAALSRNRVIGLDNQMPWHLPEDLKYFKRMTQGKPLVMGRKTFESIGKPLPGRRNIVVTRRKAFHPAGVEVCHDLESALRLADRHAQAEGAEEIMVMGGAQIYTQALSRAQRLYLTEVAIDIDGDAYFPGIDSRVWREVQRMPGAPTPQQPDYTFVTYQRAD